MEDKSDVQNGKQPKRKLNTVLFILGATVANVAVMLAIWFLLTFLYARFLSGFFNQSVSTVIIVLIIFISMISSYFFYHFFVRWLGKKVDMERYFDPIVQIKSKK